MTKKLRLLERTANGPGDFGIEKISFSRELGKYFVSVIRPESVADRHDIRVGDVLSSVTSISRLATLKKSLSKMTSSKKAPHQNDIIALTKKLRLNFKKRDFQCEETFYNHLSQNVKIFLSIRRYSNSSHSALFLSLALKTAGTGGGSFDSSYSDSDFVVTKKTEKKIEKEIDDSISSLITSGAPSFLSFYKYNELLTYAEAHPEIISNETAVRPQTGSIIFYDYSSREFSGAMYDEGKARSHFRCDQYHFGQHNGQKPVGKNQCILRSVYKLYDPLLINGRPEFQRLEVRKKDSDKKIILFHYVGDTELAVEIANKYPHGNSKTNFNAYVRTKSFVNMNIAAKVQSTNQTPHQIYTAMQLDTELGQFTATDTVRNTEQVRNVAKQEHRKFRHEKNHIFNSIIQDRSFHSVSIPKPNRKF